MKPKEGEVTSRPWHWPIDYQVCACVVCTVCVGVCVYCVCVCCVCQCVCVYVYVCVVCVRAYHIVCSMCVNAVVAFSDSGVYVVCHVCVYIVHVRLLLQTVIRIINGNNILRWCHKNVVLIPYIIPYPS